MMMTYEQAIAVFKNMIRSNNEHGNTLLCIGEVQALEMAIEALSNNKNQTDSLIRTSTDSVSEADVIYRQQAIGMVDDVPFIKEHPNIGLLWKAWLEDLPSAQQEIIRCKDCIKSDCCRTTNIWAVPPADDWYCGDAERRTE